MIAEENCKLTDQYRYHRHRHQRTCLMSKWLLSASLFHTIIQAFHTRHYSDPFIVTSSQHCKPCVSLIFCQEIWFDWRLKNQTEIKLSYGIPLISADDHLQDEFRMNYTILFSLYKLYHIPTKQQ